MTNAPQRSFRSLGRRPLIIAIVGIVVLAIALTTALRLGMFNKRSPVMSGSATTSIAASSTESTTATTREEYGATTNPSVPAVGEGPDTTVPPHGVPNAQENPFHAGIDPCKLATLAEVHQWYAPDAAEGAATGGGTGCVYRRADGGTLLVSVTRGDSAEKYAQTLNDVRAAADGPVETLNGVGNEAFVYQAGTASIVNGESRKNDLRLRVLINSPGATTSTVRTILTELAKRL